MASFCHFQGSPRVAVPEVRGRQRPDLAAFVGVPPGMHGGRRSVPADAKCRRAIHCTRTCLRINCIRTPGEPAGPGCHFRERNRHSHRRPSSREGRSDSPSQGGPCAHPGPPRADRDERNLGDTVRFRVRARPDTAASIECWKTRPHRVALPRLARRRLAFSDIAQSDAARNSQNGIGRSSRRRCRCDFEELLRPSSNTSPASDYVGPAVNV